MARQTVIGRQTKVGIREAARMCGLSTTVLYRLAATRDLPCEVTSPEKRLLFAISDVRHLKGQIIPDSEGE